jgi:hypothetical protein
MTEEPLYIDTDAVRAGGNEMLTALEGLQPAPPTTALTGSDPLSVAIIGQVPSIQAPIVFGLPLLKEDATKTANGVKDAADRYEKTDEMLGKRIEEQAAQLPGGPDAPGAAGAPAASGAGGAQNAAASQGGAMGQMGQLMGMPMQMAQQAAQLPMQAMGMAAALPQAVMQGVQQAVQQVGQLGGSDSSKGEEPSDEALRAEPAVEKPEKDEEPGAEAGEPRERVPDTGGSGETPSQEAPPVAPRTPAPTRPAESDEGINL